MELTSEHSHEIWTTGSQDVPVTRELCLSHNQRNVAQKPHLALLVETLQDAQTMGHFGEASPCRSVTLIFATD